MLKHGASKLRRLGGGRVVAGFAGSVADALALFTRFEAKIEEFAGNLERAAVELARDWRTDRALRHLEAMMIVADREHLLLLSGSGEVITPDDGVLAIGSGGPVALAAARALVRHSALPAAEVAREALRHRRRDRPLHQRPHLGGGGVVSALLTPREIVAELDRYIVGQAAAKRAVAIALRNRWRRQQLAPRSCAAR